MARAESSYVLVVPSGSSVDLNAHVGQKVRVRGFIEGEGAGSSYNDDQSNTTDQSGSQMSGSGQMGNESASNSGSRFDVRSIKEISRTCP
jgi:hypothetical protein